MSDTEVDYLQPGFDPATLTMPRLRSILVTHNVHYASNAKKSDLVDLFHTSVAPEASKILARRARAKRSSMGIVDAAQPAQSHSTSDGFNNGDLKPSRRSVRRSTSRQTTEEPQPPSAPAYQQESYGAPYGDEDEDLNSRQQRRSSPRKRTSRSVSHQPAPALAAAAPIVPQLSTASNTYTDAAATRARPVSSRRSRSRTPQIKMEPAEEEYASHLPPARSQQLRSSSGQSTHQPRTKHQHRSSTEEETVFTDDNPFQSGSSPLAPSPVSSRPPRRKTAGVDVSDVSTSKNRSSAGAANPFIGSSFDSGYYSRRQTTDVSSSFPYGRQPTVEPESADDDDFAEADTLSPGEEFTPEEQLELAQAEANLRRQDALNRRVSARMSRSRSRGKTGRRPQRRRQRGFLSALATSLWVLLLALLGAYGAWYRQEKIAIGYCGVGRAAVPLFAGKLDALVDRLPNAARDYVLSLPWDRIADTVDAVIPPSWHVLIEPQCELCPPNAFCYSDFSVRCEKGYILKPHVLSMGGLVPLPPTCEPDGERERRILAVADKAIEELRDRRAKWECGDLMTEEGVPAADPSIDVLSLKKVIDDKRSKLMHKNEFDDLWTAALGIIAKREEVEIQEEEPENTNTGSGAVPNAFISSTSLARLPLRCAVRRSIRLGVARYRFPLSVLVLLAAALLYVRARFRAHLADRARVPLLVDLTLERLAAQKELYMEEEMDDLEREQEGDMDDTRDDDGNSSRHDPFLFLPQLRDDVLRSTHSLAARERIWKRVRAVVEQNSNVRAAQMQGRNGEVGRAWEWVGPVGAAVDDRVSEDEFEGSRLSGSGRRSSIYADRRVRRRRSIRTSLGSGGGAQRQSTSTTMREASVPRERSGTRGTAGGVARGAQPEADRENRSALHLRWQESRPVY